MRLNSSSPVRPRRQLQGSGFGLHRSATTGNALALAVRAAHASERITAAYRTPGKHTDLPSVAHNHERDGLCVHQNPGHYKKTITPRRFFSAANSSSNHHRHPCRTRGRAKQFDQRSTADPDRLRRRTSPSRRPRCRKRRRGRSPPPGGAISSQLQREIHGSEAESIHSIAFVSTRAHARQPKCPHSGHQPLTLTSASQFLLILVDEAGIIFGG